VQTKQTRCGKTCSGDRERGNIRRLTFCVFQGWKRSASPVKSTVASASTSAAPSPSKAVVEVRSTSASPNQKQPRVRSGLWDSLWQLDISYESGKARK